MKGKLYWTLARGCVVIDKVTLIRGVKRGFVYGKSDANGMYPDKRPVRPEDPAATLYYLMGIDPDSEIRDRNNRPLAIAGQPVLEVVA